MGRGLLRFEETELLPLPNGTSGGFEQESRGREVTFMKHPLCAGHCSGTVILPQVRLWRQLWL